MHRTPFFLGILLALVPTIGQSQNPARGSPASTQANDVAQATMALQGLFAAT